MTIFLDFVASTVKAFFLFMTFDFVKVTIKSRLHVGSTINFVHYVEKCEYFCTAIRSYARGEQREDSDNDILVAFDPRPADSNTAQGESPRIYSRDRAEAVSA